MEQQFLNDSRYKRSSHIDKTDKLLDTYAKKRIRERGDIKTSKTLSSNYKAVTGGSAYQNGILSSIVDQLKSNFLDGEVHAVPFDEVLELTSQKDISISIKMWLQTEALPNNARISINERGHYVYNPPLDCWNRRTLVTLLKKMDNDGPLGVLEDLIVASIPHGERVLQELEDDGIVFYALRGDKRKVYFYQGGHPDPQSLMPELYQRRWKDVFIYGIDDAKIEEELTRSGIKCSNSSKFIQKVPRSNPTRRKTPGGTVRIRDNEHVKDLLIPYDNMQLT